MSLAGNFTYTEVSGLYSDRQVMLSKLQIINYESYETYWFKQLSSPHTKFSGVQFKGSGEAYVNMIDPGQIIVYFSFQPYVLSYVRAPMSLWSGLSRIGGIMAIFKIAIIALLLFNKYRFEKKVMQVLGGYDDLKGFKKDWSLETAMRERQTAENERKELVEEVKMLRQRLDAFDKKLI